MMICALGRTARVLEKRLSTPEARRPLYENFSGAIRYQHKVPSTFEKPPYHMGKLMSCA